MNFQAVTTWRRCFVGFCASGACLLLSAVPGGAAAQESDVLTECVALSSIDDDIHACLDNYLDVMDDNLRDITAYIRREFSGNSRAAFDRSQAAFESFRRENCLWYLAISSPRSAAEQIAKNCLARHSIDRLSELQGLLALDDATSQVVDGFYVYGANRNSFRPCGSDGRYLVAGNANAVGDLQQRYSNLSSVDLQILFASVTGEIDNTVDGGLDHDGVINVSSVRDVRFPSDSDCNLPTGSPQVAAVSASDASVATTVEERVADIESVDRSVAPIEETSDESSTGLFGIEPPEVSDNPVADPGPVPVPSGVGGAATLIDSGIGASDGQALTAYFGAWLAECSGESEERRCRLAVELDGGAEPPILSLNRRTGRRTVVELSLPGRELASIDEILWGIDGLFFGQVPGSKIEVEDRLTLQRLTERRFVEDELLPLMRKGSDLRVEIATAANGGAAQYRGTLQGLTRALGFADEFLGN